MNVARCRNCETVLLDRWCHACGQDSRDPLRDFSVLASEFLDNVFGWDSRLVRSLRLLAGSPGALTAEFVAGRRVRFLGPLRMYLIASVAFFACFTLTPDPVLGTIAGLGDWRTGLFRMEYASRWIPTMMIVVLPGFALIIKLLFRSPPRPFLEHLVFVLHYGAACFLVLPAGQLLAFALTRAGMDNALYWPLFVAHSLNATYFYFAARRYYGLGPVATMTRILGFCLLLTLMLGGVSELTHHIILMLGAR